MEKKKVAIVTLVNFETNYGNRLQNYALTHFLEKHDCLVETLNDVRYVKHDEASYIQLLRFAAHYISRYKYVPMIHKRALFFWSWVKRYRKTTWRKFKKDSDYEYISNSYDYFITGSDQIWRPIFEASSNSACFLQFAKPSQRIAYAPSFGMRYTEFPKEKVKIYKEWLSSGWKSLSVREKEGAEAVLQMTGEQIPVVLDPTMLLDVSEWNKIARKTKAPKHYVLVYCLRCSDYLEYVKKFAQEKNVSIVDIGNDDRYAGCGPSEFLYLIRNADYVLTNSFHCNVFAFLYHKAVTYYVSKDVQTASILSRLESLWELANLKITLESDYIEYPKIDWDLYERNLSNKRNKSMDYLLNALN